MEVKCHILAEKRTASALVDIGGIVGGFDNTIVVVGEETDEVEQKQEVDETVVQFPLSPLSYNRPQPQRPRGHSLFIKATPPIR